jgi:hypothetical protein
VALPPCLLSVRLDRQGPAKAPFHTLRVVGQPSAASGPPLLALLQLVWPLRVHSSSSLAVLSNRSVLLSTGPDALPLQFRWPLRLTTTVFPMKAVDPTPHGQQHHPNLKNKVPRSFRFAPSFLQHLLCRLPLRFYLSSSIASSDFPLFSSSLSATSVVVAFFPSFFAANCSRNLY